MTAFSNFARQAVMVAGALMLSATLFVSTFAADFQGQAVAGMIA